jgi:hypothetical protein
MPELGIGRRNFAPKLFASGHGPRRSAPETCKPR